MQSGTSFCLWSFSRLGPNVARQLAKNLNINSTSSKDILSSLQKIDAFHLHQMAREVQNAVSI